MRLGNGSRCFDKSRAEALAQTVEAPAGLRGRAGFFPPDFGYDVGEMHPEGPLAGETIPAPDACLRRQGIAANGFWERISRIFAAIP